MKAKRDCLKLILKKMRKQQHSDKSVYLNDRTQKKPDKRAF
jgi:hypothetical protein